MRLHRQILHCLRHTVEKVLLGLRLICGGGKGRRRVLGFRTEIVENMPGKIDRRDLA